MKSFFIKLVSTGMVIIFLGHVTGMRDSEHSCLECGTKHMEIGNNLHALHMILSQNQDHSLCCDPFHEQHQDHSNTCSHSFLSYTVPFKVIEKTGQNLQNPLTFLIRETGLFRISAKNPCFINTSISNNPVYTKPEG